MKSQTKGNKVLIRFGKRRQATFTAGGRRRYVIEKVYGDKGVVAVNGELRFHDGTEAWAILIIDEASSGEHSGTGVFLPDGDLTFQDDDDFLQKLGKKREDVFPYRYRYSAAIAALADHHVGDDGWSH